VLSRALSIRAEPDIFILIGPNHTGLGASVSDVPRAVGNAARYGGYLRATRCRNSQKSAHIHEDTLAHLREHSLEVQLPYPVFQACFQIVPLQMLDTTLTTCLEVGQAIAAAIKELGPQGAKRESEDHDVLIVASSEMSHYERAATAKDKDSKAIQQILNLDPLGLYRTVRDNGITMCGYGPAVSMLAACNALGASRAELIKYANSGDVSGDYEQVVGYGIVIM
jgi:AmmeMemoRadiSam system protein B